MSEESKNAGMGDLVVKTDTGQVIDPVQIISKLQLQTDEERMQWFNALAGAGAKLDELVGKTIMLKNALTIPHVFKGDEEGEVVNGTITFLQTVDGKVYFSASGGISKSVALITLIFRDTPMPWEKGKKFLVKQLPIGKNRYYHLELMK